MASQTSIANSSLRKIGAKRITNITDGSKNANVLLDLYDPLREELLEQHNWNFAITRSKLARAGTSPIAGFTYRYSKPPDFRRLVAIYDNANDEGSLDYLDEGGFIHTSAEEVYLRYVRNEEDPNKMSALFRETLAYRLAVDAAIPIRQSGTLSDRMRDKYDENLSEAKSVDSMQDPQERMPDGSWVTDREL